DSLRISHSLPMDARHRNTHSIDARCQARTPLRRTMPRGLVKMERLFYCRRNRSRTMSAPTAASLSTAPATTVSPLVPWPLVATTVVLATTPWWLHRIGLYQYLALEIAIFMIYAMGYNLLL